MRKTKATPEPARPLATPEQVAEFLGVPIRTIYSWRRNHTGPPGFRVGRHIRYRWSDVEGWITAQQSANAA